jgi:hypothetical protein
MNTNNVVIKASDLNELVKLASYGMPEGNPILQGIVQSMYALPHDLQCDVIRGVMHLLMAICAPDDDVAVEVNERNLKAIQLVADIVHGFGDRMVHL